MRRGGTPRSSVHTPRSNADTSRSGGETPRDVGIATPRDKGGSIDVAPVEVGSWSGDEISKERERQKKAMIQNKVAILCKSCNGYSPFKAKECENCLKNLDKERKMLELSAARRERQAGARRAANRHRKFLEKEGVGESVAMQ
mmetsp:Transcript_41074/g.95279  ORF Transcript_41074/g.95279 Transcript_41074/m.95279 type:complete len:143 (+) Transcript_41074:527-955(+)